MNKIFDLLNVEYELLEVKEKENIIHDTMDIEVADTHYYTLNNGIVSHNTLSLISRTSSGIEPVFKCYYKRRRKINPNESGVKIDYKDDNGDSWQEYNVFHPEFEKWGKNTEQKDYLEKLTNEELDKLVAKSPWAGSESHNVDYIEKINMQGVIQKWIDNSISITHNLPENISLEEVNKIYFHAWKVGCKGCTIYREGSRQGVLITKKEDEFKVNHAPKRPKILESDYYVATVKGVKFAVIVGLWPGTNRPYEVFAFENPPMDKNCKGRTIKVKKGLFKFINGEFEIPDLNLAMNRVEEKTLTLSASMILRHGAPVKYVNHIITKIDENVTSFSSALRRTLSRYIEDEQTNEKCPECGSSLRREEGCLHCVQCSYSKCG